MSEASPAQAPEQQNDLSKSFTAESSCLSMTEQQALQKHLSVYLKGRLVTVPFTVQIHGTEKNRLHTVLTSSGKPCPCFNLVLSSGSQTTCICRMCTFFLSTKPQKWESFLTLILPTVHEPVTRFIWAVWMYLSSSALTEIQKQVTTVFYNESIIMAQRW